MHHHDDSDDAPLDPAAERLRRKLVRLLFVSGGIMLLGLIAVFSAIVYKVRETGEAVEARLPAGAPVEAAIRVPAGYRLVAADLDGERALLRVEAPDGAATLLLVDLPTGTIVGRYSIEAE